MEYCEVTFKYKIKNKNIKLYFFSLQGGSLDSKIKAKKIDKNTYNNEMIEKWSKQLIQGLNFLHNNSIMHRDIKPELVFNFIN